MSNRLAIVLVSVLVSPAARAAVINVPGDQSTIQAGIDAAVTGDEVVVAPGTYVLEEFESVVINSKNITLRSSGGAAVTTIRGGGVFQVMHLGINASVVQGFTITEGTYYDFPVIYSGGINIVGGSPTIVDCIFTDNFADEYLAGSAIGVGPTADCTIIGCTFINNVNLTSAVYVSGTATISDCLFQDNAATLYEGGAIRLNQGTIENCTFTNNYAAMSGGAVYSTHSVSITGCTFVGNTASSSGGGVRISGGTVTDCTFDSNVAGGSGGGLWLEDGFVEDAVVIGSTFFGNSAANGGGLRIIGGELTDCTFDSNTATSSGGGVYISGATPVMTQCTLSGNTAGATGGGMYIGGDATLTDSSFCQNMPDDLDANGVLLASGVVIAINGADCDEALATCSAACPTDLDGDGMVGIQDFLAVLATWGVCP